jgi:hypothetical protein
MSYNDYFNSVILSDWPMITHYMPISFNCSAETSPVFKPSYSTSNEEQFWAATSIASTVLVHWTVSKCKNVGATTTST